MKNKLTTVMNTLEDELGKVRRAANSAKSNAYSFGMFDDCGPEYERDHIEAKAVLEYMEKLMPRLREIAVEKETEAG